MNMITLPNTWTIEAPNVGRLINCGPYRTRRDALAAIQDRTRNGHAYPGEKPARVRLALRWDGHTMHAVDTAGK